MIPDLEHVLNQLPDNPGVYFFYTGKELVYVGKATSLRDRVRSYFRGQKTPRPVEDMLHTVTAIDWQVTDSVLEAIVLESLLIKKHQPKYNVLGKDDKSWNYIVITKDPYPQVKTIRQHELAQLQKNSKLDFLHLFGPYPGLNGKATMKVLRRLFRISLCKPNQGKPCLYYQMGQCLGVCTGEISAKDYRAKVIRPLVAFLGGRKKTLVKQLEIQMRKAVRAEQFEEAGRLRDQIFALEHIQDVTLLNRSFVGDQTSDVRLQAEDRSPASEVHRIEGYDISNLGSTGKVGSMVVFVDGEPSKNNYRKYKIRTVEGQSDVECLEEVIRRRLKHTEWTYPEVFLIDGGKPQVNQVKKVFAELGVTVPIVGIAKGPDRKKNEIILGSKDKDFVRWVYGNTRTLIAVRDEAHRFAITYQRATRKLR